MYSRGSELKNGKRRHGGLSAALQAGGEAGGGGGPATGRGGPETSAKFLLRDGAGAGDGGGKVRGAGRNWAARV